MAVSSKFDDLGPAIDLILQPLLLETLVATDEGKAREDALPADTDAELLDAALQRLIRIRAVQPSTGRLFGHHKLTNRGGQLLRLLEDLDAAMLTRDAAHHE